MGKITIDFNIKCRSCLTEDQEMHHLFMEVTKGHKLSDILRSTINIEIEENDELSPYLCEHCRTIVVDFFNFKIVYMENDSYLRSLFKKKFKAENESFTELKYCGNEFTGNSEENSNTDELQARLKSIEYVHTENEDNLARDFLEKEDSTAKYFCEECNEHFSKNSSLEKHKHEIHDEAPIKLNIKDKSILQCSTCDDKFKTSSKLEEHCKTHKNFICEICGAGFLRKSSLNDHTQIHTSEEKRHVCSFCGKAFRQKSVLGRHKRIHTHPKQCVCEICGLRFTHKVTLTTHIQLKHTKERNFNCTICGLRFPLKSTLMKHINRHNKDRKQEYPCSQCSMAYKDKSSLKRHVEVKHTENSMKHTCSFCQRHYTTKTNLFKHIRKHHKPL